MSFYTKAQLLSYTILATSLLSTKVALTAPSSLSLYKVYDVTADTLDWAANIPLNPIVKTGRLKNGFTYFIAKHNLPEKQVFIHLINKVGSVQETDEQHGLAHFLEHMNFNGLKHFPKNSVIDYLQRYGVNFGADLNAHTSFEETVYKLKIPSGQPELLKNSLQIARDWAQDATLEDEEINNERGIIVEEMRGLRNADNRMREQYYGPIMNYSRFAARRPIGTEEVVTHTTPQLIKKFYKDWYRPDIESLVVVGDIDEKYIEQEIIRLFSDLKMPSNPPVLKKYTLDLNQKNKFVTVTDPEAMKTSGEFIFKFKEKPLHTVGDYRYTIIRAAFNSLIAARINEIKLMPNSPFNDIGIKYDQLIGETDLLNAYFTLKTDDFETGFKTLQRELLRLQRHGFTKSELDRYVTKQKKSYEKFYASRSLLKSDQIVKNITDYFLEKGTGADVSFTYQMATQLLPTLTVQDINEFLNNIISDWKRDILITAPERLSQRIPKEALVNQWLKSVNKEDITAYEDETLTVPLLKTAPTPGSIISEKLDDKSGIREILLSNGTKVLLKKSDSKPNQIIFSATSPGGFSLATEDNYPSTVYSPSLIAASGIGQYNPSQLRRYLSGIRASMIPNINEKEEGFNGSADREGLKYMFEMLYAYFTEPRLEKDVLNNIKTSKLAAIDNAKDDPMSQFNQMIDAKLNSGNTGRIPIDKTQIETIDETKVMQVFKERFADASDFTFILVGDIDEEAIRPLLEQYVASLPSLNRNEKAKESISKPLQKGIKETIYKGKENKTSVRLIYFGDFDYSLQENANMKALNGILNYMLTERLREEETGVYGISIGLNTSKAPKSRFNLNILFGSSVDKTPALINATIEEIHNLKKNGPNQVHLDKYMAEQRRNLENRQRGNYGWMALIESEAKGEMGLSEENQMESLLNNITIDSIKKVANKYLNDKKLHQFVLMPDQK